MLENIDKIYNMELLDNCNIIARCGYICVILMNPSLYDLHFHTSIRLMTVYCIMGSKKECIHNTRNNQTLLFNNKNSNNSEIFYSF